MEAAAKKVTEAKSDLEQKLAAFAQKRPCYDLMRDRGAWTERVGVFDLHQEELHLDQAKKTVKVKAPQFWSAPVEYPLDQVKTDPRTQQLYVDTAEGRHNIGVRDGEKLIAGFGTPSRKMEFYSRLMKDWGWPEYALPIYPRTEEQRTAMVHIVSQVHHRYMTEPNAFALNPIFRLPYNIHTRGVNSKWLMEISQNHNPLWMNTKDAARLGFVRGEPVKVRVVDTLTGQQSGYFVAQCQPTEGQAPGVLSCSHHAGRWRRVAQVAIEGFEQPLHVMRLGSVVADIQEKGTERTLKYTEGVTPFTVTPTREFGERGWPFAEFNADLDNISWDGLSGVWQNSVHHPHPDPVSGMHCWHQKVLLEKCSAGEKIGDLQVDIAITLATFRAWRDQLTRPAPGPGGLRRPEYIKRPWVAITREAYQMKLKQ